MVWLIICEGKKDHTWRMPMGCTPKKIYGVPLILWKHFVEKEVLGYTQPTRYRLELSFLNVGRSVRNPRMRTGRGCGRRPEVATDNLMFGSVDRSFCTSAQPKRQLACVRWIEARTRHNTFQLPIVTPHPIIPPSPHHFFLAN